MIGVLRPARPRLVASVTRRDRLRLSASIAAALTICFLSGACAPLAPQGSVDLGAQSDQWMVRWDNELHSPVSLVNRSLAGAPGSPGTIAASDSVAEAAVREVFRERALWFSLRPGLDDFRVVRSYTRGWLRYMRFEQTYRGVSVAGAGYEATVLANGRVGSLEGRYHPGLSLDLHPLLTADQAENRARAIFLPGVPLPQGLPSVQFENENGFRERQVLAIVPIGRLYVLAWGVVVPAIGNDHARVYVDARDGSPIGRQMVGSVGPR